VSILSAICIFCLCNLVFDFIFIRKRREAEKKAARDAAKATAAALAAVPVVVVPTLPLGGEESPDNDPDEDGSKNKPVDDRLTCEEIKSIAKTMKRKCEKKKTLVNEIHNRSSVPQSFPIDLVLKAQLCVHNCNSFYSVTNTEKNGSTFTTVYAAGVKNKGDEWAVTGQLINAPDDEDDGEGFVIGGSNYKCFLIPDDEEGGRNVLWSAQRCMSGYNAYIDFNGILIATRSLAHNEE